MGWVFEAPSLVVKCVDGHLSRYELLKSKASAPHVFVAEDEHNDISNTLDFMTLCPDCSLKLWIGVIW
jgi:hypothetical protein